MLTVQDIWEEIQAVLGTCNEAQTYSKINEAVRMLSNTGHWDPQVAIMDICTMGCEITLPDEVEAPLAINVGGYPCEFRDKWFEFHLNGPGTECCERVCEFEWTDKGEFPCFRDPIKSSYVAAYPDLDEGNACTIRVYGYDVNSKWIMTPDLNGNLVDGFDVPVIFGIGSGQPSTVKVKRITRIQKPVTKGFVRLSALDPGSASGSTLLGLFRPSEQNPSFRRISISGSGCQSLCGTSCVTKTWVRMRFKRKVFKVSQQSDIIPLHSSTAIKFMVMALKKAEDDLADQYQTYFGLAEKALENEQKARNGPNQTRIQFQRGEYGGRPYENMI